MRAEEFVYEKLDKPKPPRLTESETLGQSMIEAGNDFGPGTNYGEIYRLQCNTLFKKTYNCINSTAVINYAHLHVLRLSQSPSLLIPGCGSWPRREGLLSPAVAKFTGGIFLRWVLSNYEQFY